MLALVIALSSLIAVDSTFAANIDSSGPNAVAPQELIDKARVSGSVRVIVQLAESVQPEGRLANIRAKRQQRRQIAAAQSGLLSELTGTNHRVLSRYQTIPFVALEATPSTLQALERSSKVVSVQEDGINYTTLYDSIPIVQADQAWAAGFDGSGQAIVIIDTGVDSGHPFLAGKVVAEACFSQQNCPDGSSAQTGLGSGVPCIGDCDHGTHVAGIAAGTGPNFSGVAKGADLISIRVFTVFPDGSVLAFDSHIIQALDHVALLNDTMTIASANMSLGSAVFSNQAQCDNANQAELAAMGNLRSLGIVTAVASGNNGDKNGITAPGCVSTAVSVGSTTKSDSVSSFSNSASFLDLLAPGQSIQSSIPGTGFAFFSGTSMAAPHVAGAWAILKQNNPTASVDFILDSLTTTGKKITDVNGITTPRIQVFDALGGPVVIPSPSPRGRVYEVTVTRPNGEVSADCYRFGDDNTFSVDTVGTGGWREFFVGPQLSFWGATAAQGLSNRTTVFGLTFLADGDVLRSRGRNGLGEVISISGFENPGCSVPVT